MRITGSVYPVETTDQGQAQTRSEVVPEIAFHAEDHGDAFSWSNATYDYDAADTILLVQNNDDNKLLFITDVWVYGDTASVITIHCPEGVTPTGTAVTAVSLNRSNRATPNATAKGDETGNTQGNIVVNTAIHAALEGKHIDLYGAVILGYNDSIGVDYVTNGTAAWVTIWGFFK